MLWHSLSSRWMLVALSLCLPLASGCRQAPSETQQETVHEEEEHFPRHWPGSIHNAARRLRDLSQGAATHESVTCCDEVRDLIKWLPELAADSDVEEPLFDEIDQLSTRLFKMLAQIESEQEMRQQSLQGEDFRSLLALFAKLPEDPQANLVP